MIGPVTRRLSIRRGVLPLLVAGGAATGCWAGTAAASAHQAGTVPHAKTTPKCSSYKTITTGYNISAAYAPPWIIQKDGYARDYCLKIVDTPVEGGAVLLAQVESGHLDMGLLTPAGIVQAVEAGVKLKIIAPGVGPGDQPICTANNSGITNINQLGGKSVGTTLLGSSVDIAFRVVLASHNVDTSTINFVQIPSASVIPEVLNGTVAASACPEPAEAQNASQLRILDKDPLAQAWGSRTPSAYMYTTAAYAAKHKATIKAYQKAYLAFATAVSKNENVFSDGIAKFAKIPRSIARTELNPLLLTTYGYPTYVRNQLQGLKAWGAIQSLLPAATMKALFVPLPRTSTTGK